MASKTAPPSISIKPLGSMVVVRAIARDQKPSPIIRVTLEQDTAMRGEVVAIGSEVKTVAIGQRVLFSRMQGYELDIGAPMILIRERAILATV